MGFYDLLQSHDSLLSVLIDPDKEVNKEAIYLQELLAKSMADLVLVGGSTLDKDIIDKTVLRLKKVTSAPIVLFPGNALQLSSYADAMLLPLLLSGRNPEYLIGQHVRSALKIKKLGIEVVPVGYILISDNQKSSTSRVTQTEPIHPENIEEIISTAIAGELIGMKAIYLEAGSGAQENISQTIASLVSDAINIPLIVGGGIDTIQKYKTTLEAKPDMVVVGNALEKQPKLLESLREVQKKYNAVNEARHHNKIYR